MFRLIMNGFRMLSGLVAGVLSFAAAILLAVASVLGARVPRPTGQTIAPSDVEARVPPGWRVSFGLEGNIWYAEHPARGIQTSAANAFDLLDIIHSIEGVQRKQKRKASKS